MEVSRRSLLGSGFVILSLSASGCLSQPQQERRLSIRVNNRTDTSETVSVTVTDSDGEVRDSFVDEEVPAGVSENFETTGYEEGRYGIEVQGGNWATSGYGRRRYVRTSFL